MALEQQRFILLFDNFLTEVQTHSYQDLVNNKSNANKLSDADEATLIMVYN